MPCLVVQPVGTAEMVVAEQPAVEELAIEEQLVSKQPEATEEQAVGFAMQEVGEELALVLLRASVWALQSWPVPRSTLSVSLQ